MRVNYTIAFYNLENLFDTEDNPNTLDDDFLPSGRKFWTKNRYQKKIKKLGKAISQIGTKETDSMPVLVGVSEVENAQVINDLIETKYLKDGHYDFVHYDSPDERGIDVGLIYDASVFNVTHSEPISIDLFNEHGERDYTRDALYVELECEHEQFHIIVTHWPSRRDGLEETNPKRIEVATQIRAFLDLKIDELSKVIIMGDFNDNPDCESVNSVLKSHLLFNPFEQLQSITRGSLSFHSEWFLFDQILLSHNFLSREGQTFKFDRADIFDARFLQEWHGRRKGTPFRTYRGNKYVSGFSDHFPVYVNILLEK